MPGIIARLRQELPKILSFGTIGAVNAVVNYAIFIALLHYVLEPFDLEEDRLAIAGASIAGWAVAVSNSYFLNTRFTFAAQSGGAFRLTDYGRFVAAGLFGMATETIVLLVAREFIVSDYNTEIAKLLSIGAAFVVNFSATRLLVYR